MGWSGGDDIVDPVIVEMANWIDQGKLHPNIARDVLGVLIRACQDRDWDCEGDTLRSWDHVPWVVEAFSKCEIYLRCPAVGQLHIDNLGAIPLVCEVVCSLPKGHTVDHFDEEEDLEWPLTNR